MEFEEEILKSLCNGLEDESKSRRKSTLTKLRQETLEKLTETAKASDIFDQIFKPVLKLFNDPSEICRELAVNLIADFVTLLPSIDSYMAYIVTVLLKRIGEDTNLEPSEEIRLLMIGLLHKVISKSGSSLMPYFNDITKIVCNCLKDSYSRVRLESYDCTIELTVVIPKSFHVQSETYLKAVTLGIAHKHSKVRSASIVAVGAVVQHGTQGLVEQTVSGLAERLYDSNPNVRQTVVSVGGQWMRALPDRYSHFARLLPLVLTGLDDEIDEVRQLALNEWEQAGEQFLAENEEDYKNQIDFLSETLSEYPLSEQRPGLGCRLLVQKEASKLLPAALAELHDWTLAVRLQSGALLYQLVRHLEHRSTQYVSKLWPDFALVCADQNDDRRLLDKIQSTLHLLGFFVPAGAILAVALSQEQLSLGQLLCLAAALKGIKTLSGSELDTLASALAATRAASLQPGYHSCLLDCVSSVVSGVTQRPCSDTVALSLFRVLLCVQGFGEPGLACKAKELVVGVADMTNVLPEQIYTKHGQDILSALRPSVPTWTDHSAEKSLFMAFLQGAGQNVGGLLDSVADILVAWSNTLASAKSLADFLRVSQPLLSWNFLVSCNNNPQPFISTLLTDAVLPSLVWRAGRAAEAKRTQALLCLLVAVSEPELPQAVVDPLCPSLLPMLASALEESSKSTRLHAAQALNLLCPHWAQQLTQEQVQKINHVLAKRLDDTCREVRLQALHAIQSVLLSLPAEHEALTSITHLEDLYKMMMIHLDDQEPDYQQAILEALKTLGKFETKKMQELLQRGRKNFKNQSGCSELSCHLETLLNTSTS